MCDIGKISIFTDTECKNIVRNALKLPINHEINLKCFYVTRCSNDLVGFLGEYYKLDVILNNEVEGRNEKHLHYFVKTVPLTNPFHRTECESKGFFVKEGQIYSKILPNIQKYSSIQLYPECYYVRNDAFVLQDLAQSKEGFRQTDSNEVYTEEHRHVVLRHLAKLHAASIAWELDENLSIGELRFIKYLFEAQIAMWNEWYETGIKGIVFLAKMNNNLKAPKIQEFINERLFKYLSNGEKFTMASKKMRNVLCHRDTWDRNIFFKYNESKQPIACQIVDFQLTRYSPPAIDVIYFIYVTTNAEQRKAIYNECLNYYYKCLEDAFVDVHLPKDYIKREEFDEDCKLALFAVHILVSICEPLMRMPEGLSNKWRSEEQERFDYYMNVERSEMFLRIMEIDANYKDIIMKPIEELIEYYMRNEELLKFVTD